MTPENFIDDVAHAMTDVDAPADLRVRVLAELESASARRWPSFAWPLAAAGAVVLALVVSRPWLTSAPQRPLTAASENRNAAAAPAIAAETDPAAAVRRGSRGSAVSADELAWRARALPPLVTRGMVIPSIQPGSMSIAPIAVEPIELDPISLPPVGGGAVERR